MSETEEVLPGSLEQLKLEAEALGLTFHPSIGYDTLEARINEELHKRAKAENDKLILQAHAENDPEEIKKRKRNNDRETIRKRALALKRVRITCMDPSKTEWDGEIFTIGNSVIGTVKKYVPYVGAEDGWHIPQILYDFLKDAKCQVFVEQRDSRGNKTRQGKLINAYAIEDLPPLTPKELKELARQQAISNRIG